MAGKLTDFEIFKSEVSVSEVCLLTAMQLKRNPARVTPKAPGPAASRAEPSVIL